MRQTLLDATELLSHVEGITDLSLYRDRSVPQLEIRLDRPALARAGLSVARVDRTIETALSGRVATELWEGERAVPVRLRLARAAREDVDRIGDVRLASPTGAQLRIRDVADLEVTPGRASINREGGRRSMALKFNVEGRDVGSVVHEAMDAVSHGITPPEGNTLVWAGEFENQQRAMSRLSVVVPLSLLAVFVLLVAALGSARGAVSVMVISPLCLVGGAVALLVAGVPLSVSAAIGFIALLGQISLASLLVLSAIEERRKEGATLDEAVREGAVERVRAVVLTALLAMLGLMPMAIGHGVGSETQRPFALVLIGGVASTIVVVLLVLPGVYRAIAGIGGARAPSA
jgi:heavy metal efflux system protein